MTQTIDAAAFQQMVIHAAASINAEKQQINDLNVFPVPDGDTGTNMSLTIGAAAIELKKNQYATVGLAAKAAASALLRGARGNSGVILSLLFRGFAKGNRYTLANGQVWEQIEPARLDGVKRTDPAVTIKPGLLNSWVLRIDGYNTPAKVRRIK